MVILSLSEDELNLYFIAQDKVASRNTLKFYLSLSPLPNLNYNLICIPVQTFPLVLWIPGVAWGPISSCLISNHSSDYYYFFKNQLRYPSTPQVVFLESPPHTTVTCCPFFMPWLSLRQS